MEREINIKYLISECIRHWKGCIIVGIIFAVLLCGKSFIDENVQSTSNKYASYGEIIIEENIKADKDTKELTEIIKSLEKQDNGARNTAIFACDEVIYSIEKDIEKENAALTVDEIRNMIHLRALNNGEVIEVNVVGEDENTAQLVCEKLLTYGTDYLQKENYNAEILQYASKQGPVSLEMRDSTSDPRTKLTIITPKEEIGENVSLKSLIKSSIVGIVLGILIWCVVICIRFVARERIVYSDQLEYLAGVNVIGISSQENIYRNIYSKLYLGKGKLTAVSFSSVGTVRNYESFIEGFLELLQNAGKRVLEVKYVSKCDTAKESLNTIEKAGRWITEIDDAMLIRHDGAEKIIEPMKDDYDLILVKCGDIKENPIARLAGKYADETVLMLEPDKVRISEMIVINESLVESNEKIAGAILMK